MSGNRIANTPKHKMHALAFQGIMVTDCYPQLRDMLHRNPRFGDAYVLLFAEPVCNTNDNTIDWYSPVQGTPRLLSALPPEEQNVLRDKISSMARELQRFACELKNDPEPSRSVRGAILELALRYPDESSLYVVGGQPVFTCWGFGPGTPDAEPQDLWRLSRLPVEIPPAPPKAEVLPAAAPAVEAVPETPPIQKENLSPPPPPPVHRTGLGWLWWILPLLLLLLLAWVLLTSFGTWPALSGITVFHAPPLPFSVQSSSTLEELARLRLENETLTSNLVALRERLAVHAEMCQQTTSSVQKPAPSSVLPVPEHPQRPVAPVTPPKKDEDVLVIPEKPQDLSFLQGRWRCETGLANSRTNEPLVVEFIFDKHGKGITRIYEKNTVCKGTSTAQFTQEGLRVLADDAVCGDGRSYQSQEIDCIRHADGAQCTGKGSQKRWDARFVRHP